MNWVIAAWIAIGIGVFIVFAAASRSDDGECQ